MTEFVLTEAVYLECIYGDFIEPTIRKEDLVRCRDCEHYEPNTYSCFTCELLQFHVEPDGFCAWGERRDA